MNRKLKIKTKIAGLNERAISIVKASFHIFGKKQCRDVAEK